MGKSAKKWGFSYLDSEKKAFSCRGGGSPPDTPPGVLPLNSYRGLLWPPDPHFQAFSLSSIPISAISLSLSLSLSLCLLCLSLSLSLSLSVSVSETIIIVMIITFKSLRFVTISSLHCELTPTHTLNRPGHSRVQIMYNTSSTYHVQPVVLCAMWYEGTAQLFSLTEFKSHLF